MPHRANGKTGINSTVELWSLAMIKSLRICYSDPTKLFDTHTIQGNIFVCMVQHLDEVRCDTALHSNIEVRPVRLFMTWTAVRFDKTCRLGNTHESLVAQLDTRHNQHFECPAYDDPISTCNLSSSLGTSSSKTCCTLSTSLSCSRLPTTSFPIWKMNDIGSHMSPSSSTNKFH